MGKCSNCNTSMAKEHKAVCKNGCVLVVCHACAGTPQARIGTKCPQCGKIASWK